MSNTANSTTDPYLADYYGMQTANVNDSYGMQLAQNQDQKSLADLSFQQKMSALQDKLNQENDTFRDPYASRGLLNSGIYNNQSNNYANMGAVQQFAHNTGIANANLAQQKLVTDQQYTDKNTELGQQKFDQIQGINQLKADDVTRSAINDAVTAGG